MGHRTITVQDTGRGKNPRNPLVELGDYAEEYAATLTSLIGRFSEYNQSRTDTGRDFHTVVTSLDIGEQIGLGRGYTKHNLRDTAHRRKRNSIASVIQGQLYNWRHNQMLYPTRPCVSWNQLVDYQTVLAQFADEYPDEYDHIKFVLGPFDWNTK